MINILKIGEFEYRITGNVTYNTYYEKEVYVDGERYTKRVHCEETLDYDESFNTVPKHHTWIKHEINDFKWLGIDNITIWNNRAIGNYFGYGLETLGDSSNGHVNITKLAFNTVFNNEKTFGDIYSGKGYDEYYNRLDEKLLNYSELNVLIYEYGWGNSVWVSLPFKTFIKLNMQDVINQSYSHKNLINKLIENDYLPKETINTINFTNEQKRVIMLKLYQRKINYQKNRRY